MFPQLYVAAPVSVLNIPITIGSASYTYNVIYSVQVPNLEVGDLVSVSSQFQAISPYTYNVMIAWYLIRATSPTATTGTKVIPHIGENIVGNQRYMVAAMSGDDLIDTAGSYYYNVIGYSAANQAKPNNYLLIPQSEGKLWALTFRQN